MFTGNSTKQKSNKIYTPLPLCEWMTNLIKGVYDPKVILDPCSGSGNLTAFFDGVDVIDFEIEKGRNFFEYNKPINCDLVLCNPPFISGKRSVFMPQAFLEHILKLVPKGTPIILITPLGFRHNNRKNSKRIRFLETLNITSTISLPVNVFDDVLFHSEIIILNLPKLKAHYTYIPKHQESQMSEEELNLEDMKLDFDTDEEAEQLIAAIRKKQKQKRALRIETVKARIEAVMEEEGFKISDLPEMFGLSGTISQPSNTVPKFIINGIPWGGRGGSAPDFVRAELEDKGITLEQLKSMEEYRNKEHESYESDFKGS
jgi:hypothetical protein